MAMREEYTNGVLTLRWNETNKRIETMAPDGTVLSFVAMSPEQATMADAYIAALAAMANEQTIKTDLQGRLTQLNDEIIGLTNAALFTQSAMGNAVKLLARCVRLIIRVLLRNFDGTS